MKELLNNPVMVSFELSFIEDIIRVIGNAIHPKFSHDDIGSIKQKIISGAQAAIDEIKNKNDDVYEAPFQKA